MASETVKRSLTRVCVCFVIMQFPVVTDELDSFLSQLKKTEYDWCLENRLLERLGFHEVVHMFV